MNGNTFNQFIDNIEALKSQYNEFLVPFFNAKMVRCWKKMIYSLPMKIEQRDWIWEALNGDVEITKDEYGNIIINNIWEEDNDL